MANFQTAEIKKKKTSKQNSKQSCKFKPNARL